MAKTKRLRTVIAGRLGFKAIYAAPLPLDTPAARRGKEKMSSKAREAMNMKTSWQKLELLIAANYDARDYHVTLTYADGCLPPNREAARKLLKKFLVQLRQYRKARGQSLHYIYVTEDKHGDGRIHHHLIINGTGDDFDIIRSLWVYGTDIEIENIDIYAYEALAQYLTKEPREHGKPKIGARNWTSSMGLKKPEVKSEWVDEGLTVDAPVGAHVLDTKQERTEYGMYAYIKYLLPAPRKPKKLDNPRRLSGLELGITTDKGT